MVSDYLADSIILLSAAVAIVPLSQRLGLGSVLGFLFAGAIVGPSGIGLITAVEEIRHFAELGVVFLLFIIGMELKPARLWMMRRWVFGLGAAQVVISGAALTMICLALGLRLEAAIIVGLGLALSSTAFVLQILSDSGALYKTYGKRSFAILLFQDLAVVPLLALVPLLVGGEFTVGGEMGVAILEGAVILIVVVVIGRYLLRPILHFISKSLNHDIFAASAVLIVLGTAYIVAHAGFSMALGAFLAGMLISDSEYRHQVMADIQPFRAFLLGLFFMSVGMSVELSMLVADPGLFIGLLLLLLSVKVVVTLVASLYFGDSKCDAVSTALLLAQSGEFAFVIFGVAYTQGLIEATLFQQLLLLVALSMAVTPLLEKSVKLLRNREKARATGAGEELPQEEPQLGEVIIAGFGRMGRRVASILDLAHTPYVAIESDPEKVARGRELGYKVFYGDASRTDVLKAAGGERARLVLITLNDSRSTTLLVQELRKRYPHLPILARGRDSEECVNLVHEGADEAISEAFEASLQLGASGLAHLGFPQEEIDAVLVTTRNTQTEKIQKIFSQLPATR
ncbi:MAG: cation:proton antiporter [Gammaproteobacteria bacterium]|nr:cation:proton antiporter [Gammaproteobacteria bacterium]